MGTVAAPRIDERLVQFVESAASSASAAEITRAAGGLAWRLGVPRPSYQQVRVLVRAARAAPAPADDASAAEVALDVAEKVVNFLYQYPGPGLDDWYRRYK